MNAYSNLQYEANKSNVCIKIVQLAEKITIEFYNAIPDLEEWQNLISSLNEKTNKGYKYGFSFNDIRSISNDFFALAKILSFSTEVVEQTNSDLRAKIVLEEKRIENFIRYRIFHSKATFNKFVEKSLAYICVPQEDFAITEKKLMNFVRFIFIPRPLVIDPYRCFKLLFDACTELSQKDQQAIICKTMFDIFVADENYISKLTKNITTEQEIHIFHELILGLPEPSKTIQLSILRHHACDEANGFSKEVCEIFDDNLLFSNLELEENELDDLNETQKFVNSILSLKTHDQMKEWLQIKKNRNNHFKLQAVAQGIKMPDGSLLQCHLTAEEIEKAFKSEKLPYKGYEEPIDLVIINSYHKSRK